MNLHLLQLGDSALPIGGYSHSWGLEAAIEQGLVRDAQSLEKWLYHWLRDAVGPLPVTGSGFVVHVDGETAYIATNDHVVNPRPGQILQGNPKLVFDSGTPREKTVDALIMASDPGRDLAVLKVTGVKGLPRPIPLEAPVMNQTLDTFRAGIIAERAGLAAGGPLHRSSRARARLRSSGG